MVWDALKRMFGQKPQSPSGQLESPPPLTVPLAEVPWIEASENPWGVRLLDVRPVTHTMTSASQDPSCAKNAISFGGDDGTSFIGQAPRGNQTVELGLRFPIDRVLADGVLFAPRQMEHKWALFVHERRLIFVRSWTRTVYAIAEVTHYPDHVVLTTLHGTLLGDGESSELSARVADYLVYSHALGVAYPAPLPAGMSQSPKNAALWCMSSYGNRASFATEQSFPRPEPGKLLRSHSLLHLSVARSDGDAVQRYLRTGIPVDLLAGDGLAPLHWALAAKQPDMLELLLSNGSPVDVRSDEGSTPLMLAVQGRRLDQARFLLERGADARAADARGFTSLHRAAEMGQLEIAQLLLAHGASPTDEAGVHTPLSLARARNEAAMVALLENAGATR
jgi:hypothetical protein